jgi:hypothetical protein
VKEKRGPVLLEEEKQPRLAKEEADERAEEEISMIRHVQVRESQQNEPFNFDTSLHPSNYLVYKPHHVLCGLDL